MKLKVYEHSANYTATVISLPVKQKVEGLDNLVKVTVFGNDCLISKDEDPDQLYLFFPAESQLSNDFCSKNNLYRDPLLNVDQTKKGFFEPSSRVKTLKFKGVTSTGFVIPATSLMSLLPNWIESPAYCNLKIGDEFNEIEGIEICRKYVPKNLNLPGQPGSGLSKQDKTNNKLKDYLVPNQLRFHSETGHLAKNLHLLNPDDIIVLTDKWHGSSCILSKVLINKKLTWYQKLLNKIGGQVSDKEYGYIISSGKPKSGIPKAIFTQNELQTFLSNTGDFYSSNIWKRAFDDYKYALEDGISIYSELVGFTEGGSYIQKGYDYCCQPNQYKMVVYRITYTKPDGNVIEFTWDQIKDYCSKYELEHVREFYHGTLKHWMMENKPEFPDFSTPGVENIGDAFFDELQTSYNMEKKDPYCSSGVFSEGIILRIDGKSSFSAYKLKAKNFLNHETIELDSGVENIEDQN